MTMEVESIQKSSIVLSQYEELSLIKLLSKVYKERMLEKFILKE